MTSLEVNLLDNESKSSRSKVALHRPRRYVSAHIIRRSLTTRVSHSASLPCRVTFARTSVSASHTAALEFSRLWCLCVSHSDRAGSFWEMARNRLTMTPTGVDSISWQNLLTTAVSYSIMSNDEWVSNSHSYQDAVVAVKLHLFPDCQKNCGNHEDRRPMLELVP